MELTSEEIRQHGREEIEVLRTRVALWKEDYLSQAPAGGGNAYLFLCREFSGEIDEYLYPYVRRMLETEHISKEQAAEFLNFCYRQVQEVAEHLDITEEAPF